MLQRVELNGVTLPRLYIAEDNADVRKARENGIPYIKWNLGIKELLRQLLRPTLEKMFPGIKWDKVLGPKVSFRSKVTICEHCDTSEIDHSQIDIEGFDNQSEIDKQHEYAEKLDDIYSDYDPKGELTENVDIAKSDRSFTNKNRTESVFERKLKLADYVGDMTSSVNLEVLQELQLMPKFIGDIMECIKSNLSTRTHWTEGYNKKLGVPVGTFSSPSELPNLIILDVSGSIPRGISATMITLIDTLRTQVNAELIITGSNSVYYSITDDLPDPQAIRDYFGYGNETRDFYAILQKKISNRNWGHVISFGDDDYPGLGYLSENREETARVLSNATVKAVHHYHTNQSFTKTGYAKWCHYLNSDMEEHYDTSWCEIMER